MKLQCHPKRVSGNCICHQAVPALFAWELVSNPSRPCTITLAISASDYCVDGHNFTIVHRKGILNANADSLSRHDHKEITVPTTAIFCTLGTASALQTLRGAQQQDPVTN